MKHRFFPIFLASIGSGCFSRLVDHNELVRPARERVFTYLGDREADAILTV